MQRLSKVTIGMYPCARSIRSGDEIVV
jgi:hypothetical protein